MATIGDVAKQAGVSTGTVSRVLNGAPNLVPATRDRVLDAIRELGYVPNGAARSLRSRRSRAVALVVPDISNVFWPTVARGVEDTAHEQGFSVFLCNTDDDLAKQARYLQLLASQRVDGVIIAPRDTNADHLAPLRERQIPTVLLDRRVDGWNVDTVHGDSLAGARQLTRHLIGLGHTRIALITGPHHASTAQDRVHGYHEALAEAGLAPDERLVRWGEFRTAAGATLTGQILDEGLAPTAIMAANNALAKGALLALAARRLRVPQDMALVGFGDSPDAASDFSLLTMVVQPAYDLGAAAARLLFSRLDAGPDLAPRRVVLPVQLLIRRSCGSLPPGFGPETTVPMPHAPAGEVQLIPVLG